MSKLLDLDKLSDDWEEDATSINKSPLIDESVLKLPLLHSRYLREWHKQCSYRIWLENKLDEVKTERARFFSGEASPEEYKKRPFFEKVATKEKMQRLLDAEPDIKELNTKIRHVDLSINMLERILKEVSALGYSLKTVVDFKRFEAGG